MPLRTVSPLDGRYTAATAPLRDFFSEFALIKNRVYVEVQWLLTLAQRPEITGVRPFSPEEIDWLHGLVERFDEHEAAKVKSIELSTNHDVKAVEYYVKEHLAATSLADVREWVHFACTSEDINNLAYALMLQGGVRQLWLLRAEALITKIAAAAREWSDVPMVGRTHGQIASPTTVGKELAVFVARWQRALKQVQDQEYLGKLNGAVGNFNAHVAAYPEAPWPEIARAFVEGLGLAYNPLTTQIEPHDFIAELFHAISRFNTITLDFARDIWAYIGLGYFSQSVVAGEVGSSTMPHKVNPIDFENAEANLGLANAMMEHLAAKLPVSRLQRDLSDSSAMRNLGVGLGYSLLALSSLERGWGKLSLNRPALERDLNHAWETLAEPIQTVMRKCGHENPYEKLKELTRGASMSAGSIRAFVEELDLPLEEKNRLLELAPSTYVGLAPSLARSLNA